MPQIQLQKTDVQMNLKPAAVVGQQHIEQPKADLRIQQPAAILEINTTKGRLHIDSSQARRDLGMLSPMESVAKYANDGKQENLQGIARRAREGRQMVNMSGKGNGKKIAQTIAKQNHGPHRTPFNIKFVPSVGSVKVHYEAGTTDVNIQKRAPVIDAKVNKPVYQYTPDKVSYTMLQRPNVSLIDVIK